jgi:[acyl-carrier-protein] S-malonyltransferase
MKTAYIFPGQGSQRIGMGKDFFDREPRARTVFESADSALGFELSKLCFEGPEEELKLTAVTQPAILTTSVAILRAIESRIGPADFVAGHSLGEYTALVAGGALGFEEAVRLVRERGKFMQEAVPPGEGAMAAVMGCNLDVVTAACIDASERGVCSVANINSPGQAVIAGHRSAVECAVELLKTRGAKRVALLAVSAPFHCGLMKPAEQRLAPLLDRTAFSDLKIPVVTNVDAEVTWFGDRARDALKRQVSSPVQWTRSVTRMIAEGVGRFVEIGPGKVLSGLVKQISRDVEAVSIQSLETLEATLGANA